MTMVTSNRVMVPLEVKIELDIQEAVQLIEFVDSWPVTEGERFNEYPGALLVTQWADVYRHMLAPALNYRGPA